MMHSSTSPQASVPQAALSERRTHTPILPHEIVAVARLSKLEFLAHRAQQSVETFRERLLRGPPKDLLLVECHDRQKQVESIVKKLLGSDRLIYREDLGTSLVQQAKLVLSLGGDNHLQYVAQSVVDGLLVGVNSDPDHSDGVLCSFTIEELPRFLRNLRSGAYNVEEWTRAEVEVEGKVIGRALCDVAIGELTFFEMSKHRLFIDGVNDLQKGSGLLIATGAGSTGWYRSVLRAKGSSNAEFDRTSPELAFVLREPYQGRLPGNLIPEGRVARGQTLCLESLNDSRGVVALDSLIIKELSYGAGVRVFRSPHPLRVAVSWRKS